MSVMKTRIAWILALCLAAALDPLWATGKSEAPAAEKKLMPLTVEIWDRNKVPPAKGTPEDNKWTRWARDQVKPLGIDLKFKAVPRSGSQQALNVLMASGTSPDIIFEQWFWIVANYASQGGLCDLTEPLKKYGTELAKALGPDIIKAGQLQGVQYAINAYRPLSDQTHSVSYIRQDWLDKLGLKKPNNTTELAYVLKQFKQKDPAGVGVDKVIPWGKFRKSVNLWLQAELSHDIMYSFMDYDPVKLITTPEPLREGFKDWLKWNNDLYQSGCIDHEFFTRTDDEAFQAIRQNRVGYYVSNTHPWDTSLGLTSTLRKVAPEARWVGCAPIAGKDGVVRHLNNPPYAYYNMVPKTCKYPEAAILYMQWQMKPEITLIQASGFEGEHYEWCDDGYPAAVGKKNGKAYDYRDHVTEDYAYIKNDLRIMGGLYLGDDVYWKQVRAGYTAFYDAQTAQDLIDALMLGRQGGFQKPEIKLTMNTWTKYGPELTKCYDEYWVKCIVSKDFEADYALFQSELKKRGIEEYTAERQAYYEKYVKGY